MCKNIKVSILQEVRVPSHIIILDLGKLNVYVNSFKHVKISLSQIFQCIN